MSFTGYKLENAGEKGEVETKRKRDTEGERGERKGRMITVQFRRLKEVRESEEEEGEAGGEL